MSKKSRKKPPNKKRQKQNKAGKKQLLQKLENIAKKKQRKQPLGEIIISLVLFAFYAVFAAAGLYLRISDSTFSGKRFWLLVITGSVLSILPVAIWRYRIIFVITFALAITLGLSTGSLSVADTSTGIEAFYNLDFVCAALALFFAVRIYRKLPELTILGSCVAVCLWDKVLKIYGKNFKI